jgi:hypothetical protein
VVAYVSNARKAGGRLEAVPVELRCAVAAQPLAVARDTPHKHLMARLRRALLSEQSRERFKAAGFSWKATP